VAITRKKTERIELPKPKKSNGVSDLHKRLVKIAGQWLRAFDCSVVLTEPISWAQEFPDAVGWKGGESYLVECKCSRRDFRKDFSKVVRRNTFGGVGTYRFYMCPTGLIKPEDLPPKWGLLWVNENGKVSRIVGFKTRGNASPLSMRHSGYAIDDKPPERRLQDEIYILTSALRRKQEKRIRRKRA